MTPSLLLFSLLVYFSLLISIAWLASKSSSSHAAFFIANRNSNWCLVAFSMIGSTLSGVTLISLPGSVGAPAGNQFQYFQFVLGNALGFIVIAAIVLPLYYRLQVISIYQYIDHRMGVWSYKTSAAVFLLSKIIGASIRLYSVVLVLQQFIFEQYHVPFWFMTSLYLVFIWSYTYKGGLKTTVFTDTLQTFLLVLSIFFTGYFICQQLKLNLPQAFRAVQHSGYAKVFFFDHFLSNKFHFLKQLLGGMFAAIVMAGMDQGLMQKNLSCKNLQEAQKNILTFTAIFIAINYIFLSLGALLYIYANQHKIGIPMDVVNAQRPDLLLPTIVFDHLPMITGVVFMVGLTAATFATTNSALIALTTSFCIDFIGMGPANSQHELNTRHIVHLSFSTLMLLITLCFYLLNHQAIIDALFTAASYTYGPLLGLFSFALLMKNTQVHERLVPIVCLSSPILGYLISQEPKLFFGYSFDKELILVNGLITFIGLCLARKRKRLEPIPS